MADMDGVAKYALAKAAVAYAAHAPELAPDGITPGAAYRPKAERDAFQALVESAFNAHRVATAIDQIEMPLINAVNAARAEDGEA